MVWKASMECDGRDTYDGMLMCLMNGAEEGFLEVSLGLVLLGGVE